MERECKEVFKFLGSKPIETTRELRGASFIFQRLGVAIQRGNARCIHGSGPVSEEFEEMFSP